MIGTEPISSVGHESYRGKGTVMNRTPCVDTMSCIPAATLDQKRCMTKKRQFLFGPM